MALCLEGEQKLRLPICSWTSQWPLVTTGQQRGWKEHVGQVLTAFFPNVLLPAFTNNFGLQSPLCCSKVNYSASPGMCRGLALGSVHFDPDSRREMIWKGVGIQSCGGDKLTSKDVKNTTHSKSFCFLPQMWKGALVLSEGVCSVSWYEVKALYIILLSVQNELSPPRLLHRSHTVLLRIRGTHPRARTVHQRLS